LNDLITNDLSLKTGDKVQALSSNVADVLCSFICRNPCHVFLSL